MWINPLFEVDALDELHQLLAENSLATLVVENPLRAAHVPILLEDSVDGILLSGHITRSDPVEQSLREGGEALAIFHGPRAYVSAGWYDDPGLPTYNFSVVHLAGTTTMMDEDALREHLIDLVRREEIQKDPKSEAPWEMDETARQRLEKLLPLVSGFWIRVEKAQAKAKMGQNRSAGDRDRTRAHLDGAAGLEPREVSARMGAMDDGTGGRRGASPAVAAAEPQKEQ
jgi:transcriptional regulator